MAADNFNLRWNDYEVNVASSFRKLRSDSDLFDVTLITSDCSTGVFQAHKLILCVCSDFFKQLLRQQHHPHPVIYLRGVSNADLSALLDFMYLGEVNVDQDGLKSFLAVAQDLQVKGLISHSTRDQCEDLRPHHHCSNISSCSSPAKRHRVLASEAAEEKSELHESRDSLPSPCSMLQSDIIIKAEKESDSEVEQPLAFDQKITGPELSDTDAIISHSAERLLRASYLAKVAVRSSSMQPRSSSSSLGSASKKKSKLSFWRRSEMVDFGPRRSRAKLNTVLWTYFEDHLTKDDVAICQIKSIMNGKKCLAEIKRTQSSTSGMLKHFKSRHPLEYQDYLSAVAAVAEGKKSATDLIQPVTDADKDPEGADSKPGTSMDTSTDH